MTLLITVIALCIYWYLFCICVKLDDIKRTNDKNFEELCKLVDILRRIDNKNTLHK